MCWGNSSGRCFGVFPSNAPLNSGGRGLPGLSAAFYVSYSPMGLPDSLGPHTKNLPATLLKPNSENQVQWQKAGVHVLTVCPENPTQQPLAIRMLSDHFEVP